MIRGNQLPKKTHELRRIRRESFQLFEANIGERIFQQHRYRSIVDWAPNSAVLDRTTIWQQETRRKGKRRTYILCGWQQWETSRATSFLPRVLSGFLPVQNRPTRSTISGILLDAHPSGCTISIVLCSIS